MHDISLYLLPCSQQGVLNIDREEELLFIAKNSSLALHIYESSIKPNIMFMINEFQP